MSLIYPTNTTILNAAITTITTTTAVGATYNGYADVAARQLKSIQFIATGVTSGNGVFTVYVSNDGTNWKAYNRLNDNVTNTNAQFDTRVGTVTLSSNTNKMYFFPADDYFRYVTVGVTRTTDGAYTAIIQAA